MAERLDVSIGTVGNWENYGNVPQSRTLAKCAEIFEVSVIFLLHGKVEGPESGGEMKELSHWRERALEAEKKVEKLQSVIRTAASDLAEKAEASYDQKRAQSKLSSPVKIGGNLGKAFDEISKRGPGSSSSSPPAKR